MLAHCQITQHLRDAHGDRVDFPEILHAYGLEYFRLIHEILRSYKLFQRLPIYRGRIGWVIEHIGRKEGN